MTRFLTFTFAILFTTLFMSSQALANPLSAYKWKNRIIVMDVSSDRNAVAKALRNERADVLDRDLVIIDVSPKSTGIKNTTRPDSAALKELRSRLSLSGTGNQFVLIGKDGGVKARQKSDLNLQKFFALIDTMPMRKQEMRQN